VTRSTDEEHYMSVKEDLQEHYPWCKYINTIQYHYQKHYKQQCHATNIIVNKLWQRRELLRANNSQAVICGSCANLLYNTTV